MSKLPDQNTEEWLEWRRQKIGASDIPIILGVSPYCTPLTLWKRKLGFENAPPMHAGMKFGHDNEPRVRELMQQKLEMRFDPETKQHQEHEWAIASLDGYNEEKGVIIEIKCCNANDHEKAQEGKVPEKYYPQVQWQMFVANVKDAYYCSFHKEDLEFFKVDYDEDFIEKTFQEALHFHECLVDYDPPAPSEKDHIEINDPEFGKVAIEWQKAKEFLDEAKKQEKYYKDQLVAFTDDGNCQGFGVRLTRVEQEGRIDWDAVCKEYKIKKSDLEKFRKEQVGFWRASIIKQ